jgi:hypothetical protein
MASTLPLTRSNPSFISLRAASSFGASLASAAADAAAMAGSNSCRRNRRRHATRLCQGKSVTDGAERGGDRSEQATARGLVAVAVATGEWAEAALGV